MEIVLLGLEILAFMFGDYILIKRRSLYGKNREEQRQILIPRGGKQIAGLLLMQLSFLSAAGMLLWFYEADIFRIMKLIAVLGILWPVAVNDYHEYRIPNKMILMGIAIWAALLIPEFIVRGKLIFPDLIQELIAAGGSIFVCLLCMLVSRGSLGMGDLKLMVVMSLFLKIDGICYAMFFSLLVSFVACIILLLRKKKNRKDAIPFAPFILAGTYVSFILCGI